MKAENFAWRSIECGHAASSNRLDLNHDAQLSALDSMWLADLRAAWKREVQTAPPRVSAGLLRLALGHHIQSHTMGGVTKSMEYKLREVADGSAAVRVNAGTRLVREWRGKD